MDKIQSYTAWTIWRKSWAAAVLVPAVTWFTMLSFVHITLGLFSFFYSLVIHTVAYAAIGLPLFFKLIKTPDSNFWDPVEATIIGALCSGLTSGILTLLMSGEVTAGLLSSLVVSLHGGWTGFCAARAKCKLERGDLCQ